MEGLSLILMPDIASQGLISVIVPCFNTEKYVLQAIESIFVQSYEAIEVIVVDDGSTDSSAKIVKELGSRVRYVRQENQGASAARNTGVRLSTGNLIAFLDADDLWPEGSLSIKLRVLESEPKVECVYGAVKQFISPELDESVKNAFKFQRQAVPGRLSGTMLITRDAFMRVGFFNPSLTLGEAIDWVARSETANVKSTFVPDVVLRRRIHGANTVLKNRALQTDYLKALKMSIDQRRSANEAKAANKDLLK